MSDLKGKITKISFSSKLKVKIENSNISNKEEILSNLNQTLLGYLKDNYYKFQDLLSIDPKQDFDMDFWRCIYSFGLGRKQAIWGCLVLTEYVNNSSPNVMSISLVVPEYAHVKF